MKPRLRFNFTNDYSYELIKDSFCIKNNNSFSREELCTWGTIKNIHYGDIHTKLNKITNIRNENLPYITSENEKKITELCEDYDVLIADASEDYSDIGKAIQLINVDKCVAGLHTILARPKVKSFYYVYLLSSWFVRKQFMRYACGAKVLGLSKASLQKVLLPTPNLTEQNKIATFLNLYYKKIELQKKKIELIQRFLDREINDISHICEDYILFKDCYIKAGEGGTPSTSIPEFYDNGSIPFAKIEDLSKKYLFDTSSFITELGVQKSGAWIIPKNSVIYSNGATIGEVYINKIEVTTKQGILGIVPKKNISEEFLYYYMKSQYFRKEICKITTFGTILSAYLKDIDKIKLFIPEFKLQENILCKINRINKKLDLEKKKLILLERYKQGLLQQLFV